VGHVCKVGLGMWGLEETSGWLRKAVERVRGGQGWCLAWEGMAAACFKQGLARF
jgi:hypothetical protein